MMTNGYPIDPLSLPFELQKIGVDPRSIPIFHNKSRIWLYKIQQVDARAATLLKQLFLSSGGDVAVNWEVIRFTCQTTDIILFGTTKQFLAVLAKLKDQPFFGLDSIATEMDQFIQTTISTNQVPAIMGILNVTPDSFSDGGRFNTIEMALLQAEKMISEGADILDIGGESTRPGSEQVPAEIEQNRVIPILKEIKTRFPAIAVSVDTVKPKVAEKAIEMGASIINSIYLDEAMLSLLGATKVTCILMHMKGTPKDMQQYTSYPNGIIPEMNRFYQSKLEEMDRFAIDRTRIWLDPGIGFAKTPEQNLTILHHLDAFHRWDLPVLLGHSRKSFMKAIYRLPIENRAICTALYSYIALQKGVAILRVHDVAETKLAIEIYKNQQTDA